jgi:hypothetical protein
MSLAASRVAPDIVTETRQNSSHRANLKPHAWLRVILLVTEQ